MANFLASESIDLFMKKLPINGGTKKSGSKVATYSISVIFPFFVNFQNIFPDFKLLSSGTVIEIISLLEMVVTI